MQTHDILGVSAQQAAAMLGVGYKRILQLIQDRQIFARRRTPRGAFIVSLNSLREFIEWHDQENPHASRSGRMDHGASSTAPSKSGSASVEQAIGKLLNARSPTMSEHERVLLTTPKKRRTLRPRQSSAHAFQAKS